MNPRRTIPTVRKSAPYGKACAGCSRAKCKCILREDMPSCERCYRLGRDCEPSTVVRKRQSRKPTLRAEYLEEKLDNLVTLLAAKASGDSGSSVSDDNSQVRTRAEKSDFDGVETPNEMGRDPPPTKQQQLRPDARSIEAARPLPAPPTFYLTPQGSDAPCPYPPEPSASQAEQYLRIFRNHHLITFPFVHISDQTTAAELQQDWPFLWLNIHASCCKSSVEQRRLEVKIREVIAQKMLIELERNLDLLLGLVTFLTWAAEKYQGRPLLGAFSDLAMSLLFDLRLDRNSQEFPCREASVVKSYGPPTIQMVPAANRSNIERRAVLGCYVTVATIAWFLRRRPVGSTAHMEDCLRHLSEYPEAPGDTTLVAIARLYKVLEDVHSISSWRYIESSPTHSNCPQSIYVKAFMTRIDNIKKTTPAEALNSRAVKSHIFMIEALIHELPLHSAERILMPDFANFERVECFYACIQSLKHCIDNYLEFTPEEVFSNPMSLHLHFGRCTYILYRLSQMDDPSWDRAAISYTVDLLAAVQRCAALYGAVPAAVGLETDGNDIFTRASEVLRATVPTWKRCLEESGAISRATESGQADVASIDFLADQWLMDLFTGCSTF